MKSTTVLPAVLAHATGARIKRRRRAHGDGETDARHDLVMTLRPAVAAACRAGGFAEEPERENSQGCDADSVGGQSVEEGYGIDIGDEGGVSQHEARQ